MIPGITGMGIDAINTGTYFGRGDIGNGILTSLSLIPVTRIVAVGTKILHRLSRGTKLTLKVGKAIKAIKGGDKLVKLLNKAPDIIKIGGKAKKLLKAGDNAGSLLNLHARTLGTTINETMQAVGY